MKAKRLVPFTFALTTKAACKLCAEYGIDFFISQMKDNDLEFRPENNRSDRLIIGIENDLVVLVEVG